mmetsp:Transcript_71886/g.144664  ORF Transcript_71886/g.144664 Transcript_71886/m.144664 type:complete len:85 (-) Transcript_71886:47-301(-)
MARSMHGVGTAEIPLCHLQTRLLIKLWQSSSKKYRKDNSIRVRRLKQLLRPYDHYPTNKSAGFGVGICKVVKENLYMALCGRFY